MAKAEATVENLVDMIERGLLRLPEMQRRFVWSATRVRDLLDSLYRGYPSGAILAWETDEDIPLQEFSVTQQAVSGQRYQLLLDGQQRLTALSAVIRGEPVTVRGHKKPLQLLFNLEHPDELAVVTEVEEESESSEDEEDELSNGDEDSSEDELQRRFDRMAFIVSTKRLEQSPHWVKVSQVFSMDSDRYFLKRAGVTDLDDPRAEKYSQRLAKLRGIRNYVYRMDILEHTLSYDEVTEIFVRVNSLGAKLRSSDLALAQITARWRGALSVFQAFQEDCQTKGFDVELGLHLKNLISFTTGQSRFKTVGGLPQRTLREGWSACVQGMEFATNFLKNNVGIESPALLSSPFLLVALGYYGHMRDYRLSLQESESLRHWVLLANAKGRYSRGSSETMLDQDLTSLRQGGGTEELVDRLRQQVGRLDVTPDELEGRNQRSALFKTMFLAFREAGARDWKSQLAIALDHSGVQHKLQFHHIFPKATLKGEYQAREADDIANLCFIAGGTNRGISDRPPSVYFPELVDDDALAAQCIPNEPELLVVSSYRDFLRRRRELIAARLNQHMAA
jgi:hypothetical protein